MLFRSDLKAVAFSGSYADLTNTPSIPSNILHNPNFAINQRGITGTKVVTDLATYNGYFVDRWKLTSGSVTINANGSLTLNGTIVQVLEVAVGTDVTASASGGTVSYDNATKTFTVTGTNATISWAKLECGNVVFIVLFLNFILIIL